MKSNGYIAGHPRPWRPFPGLTLQTRSSAALPPSSSSSFVPSGFLQADVVTLSPEALPSVCHLPSHPHFGSGALKSWRLSFLNILSSLASSWGQWHRSSHPLGMAPCGATTHFPLPGLRAKRSDEWQVPLEEKLLLALLLCELSPPRRLAMGLGAQRASLEAFACLEFGPQRRDPVSWFCCQQGEPGLTFLKMFNEIF